MSAAARRRLALSEERILLRSSSTNQKASRSSCFRLKTTVMSTLWSAICGYQAEQALTLQHEALLVAGIAKKYPQTPVATGPKMQSRASLIQERLDHSVALTDCLYPAVQSAVMNDVIQSALAHTSLKHAGVYKSGPIPPRQPAQSNARSIQSTKCWQQTHPRRRARFIARYVKPAR